jgi:hypothetical protein
MLVYPISSLCLIFHKHSEGETLSNDSKSGPRKHSESLTSIPTPNSTPTAALKPPTPICTAPPTLGPIADVQPERVKDLKGLIDAYP